jgi:ribosomal protein S18 acetylase RimI-like enzyme
MRMITNTPQILRQLERDVLGNIVLLKHIRAFPNDTNAYLVKSGQGTATLVLLDAQAGDYDRKTYPEAAHVVLLSSADPTLTRTVLTCVPRGRSIVFKLSSDEDRDIVSETYAIARRTSILSFTSKVAAFPADDQVSISKTATDQMFELFGTLDHSRDWLAPLLRADRAFACVLPSATEPRSVCFAFETYGPVWEIGGVVTSPSHRGRGLGTRVVRAAVAELKRRALLARYQVDEVNQPSIGLARAVGMTQFLTLTHYVHSGDQASYPKSARPGA